MTREPISLYSVLFATMAMLLVELAARITAAALGTTSLAITGIARVLEAGAILAIMAAGPGLRCLGLRFSSVLTGLRRGLIWSFCFGLCVMLGAALLAAAGLHPLQFIRSPLPDAGARLVLFFAVAGLLGPMAEELFFRGVIYTFLRRWGMATALIGSTTLFVLPHLLQVRLPLTQILGGLLFGLAFEKEKNILVPMVIHVLGNLAIFWLTLLT